MSSENLYITNTIPRYQNYISSLKKQGYSIIGYARKSIGRNDEESRNKLLSSMVDCLKERSSCDKIFVSYSCSAGDELASRDMNADTVSIVIELTGVDGDTQAMISYVNSSETSICLVVIDFAGLSTNVADLYNFFSTHKKLKTVIVDKLISDNQFHEFKREADLNDPTISSSFDCRSKPVQRSRKF